MNDLRIALHGTTERVTIQNWYANPTTAQVETIQAGNGDTLLNTQVQQLIDAMAQFTTDTGLSWDAASGGAGDPGQQAQFQGILAANWQSYRETLNVKGETYLAVRACPARHAR